MSNRGHVPIRMCMGCRKKRKKEEMIRLISGADGILSLDKRKEVKGRGVYLCPDRMCLKMAQKRYRWMGSLNWKDFSYPSVEEGFHG